MRLLELAYSKRALVDARGVMAAEIILRELDDPLSVAETGGWAGTTVGSAFSSGSSATRPGWNRGPGDSTVTTSHCT